MNSINLDYPEWYKIEKATENTLKKLSTLKELEYYLKNPDEYIRRLAVVRLGELKIKESLNALKDIVDEPMENADIKNLASWAMKTISVKWSMDLYMSNKYISKYTGKEKLGDLYKISIIDHTPSIKFNFSSLLVDCELEIDYSSVRIGDDISFEVDFSIKEWFKTCSYHISSNIKKTFLKFPALIFVFLKHLVKAPAIMFKYLVRIKANKHGRNKYKKETEPYYLYENYYNKKSSITVKNALIGILRIVFFPVRMILKHKKSIAVLIASLYVFCTFTTYGRITTSKYLGMDFNQMQSDAYGASSEILSYAWNELQTIIDINNPRLPVQSAEVKLQENEYVPQPKKFKVTAKTGLNLRKQPSASSQKVTDEALENDLTVTYLAQSQEDELGKLWLFIQTPNGKTGWAYSKWLLEVGGE